MGFVLVGISLPAAVAPCVADLGGDVLVDIVLDVGAGPGALLETLIHPASTIPEAPLRQSKASRSASTGKQGEGGQEGESQGEEPELFINVSRICPILVGIRNCCALREMYRRGFRS